MAEETFISPTKHNSRYNFLSLVLLVAVCLWIGASKLLSIPHPPVGFYIGVLAFVAAVVTLWPPDKAWARAAWLIVFGAFLVLEVTTLYQQRAEDTETSRRKQAEENNRFAELLRTQQDSFTAVLRSSQQEFEATMRRSTLIFTKAEEAVSFTSGGDSFPVVFPYIATENTGVKEVAFSLSKQGKYPLYKLIVTVGRPYQTSPTSTRLVGTTFRADEYNYINKPLLFQPLPQEDIAFYSASMWARNGEWEEVMEARRLKSTIVFRWVLFSSKVKDVTPSKKVLDLADADFPRSERYQSIYPLDISRLPASPVK